MTQIIDKAVAHPRRKILYYQLAAFGWLEHDPVLSPLHIFQSQFANMHTANPVGDSKSE